MKKASKAELLLLEERVNALEQWVDRLSRSVYMDVTASCDHKAYREYETLGQAGTSSSYLTGVPLKGVVEAILDYLNVRAEKTPPVDSEVVIKKKSKLTCEVGK